MRAVEVTALSKRFAGPPVLENLSVAVDAGRVLCVTGPSGCGKTTLLRLIAGLERPDAGTIRLHGKVVDGDGVFVPPRLRPVAMVFQDFALWPHMRVARHLEFVLCARHVARSERHRRLAALLDLCALQDKRRAYPNELSGGQQQRLSIARALAVRSGILLLDEPFSNLDEALRSRIGAEIIRLANEQDTTVILATHDPEDTAISPDVVLRFGKAQYVIETTR